MRVERAAGERIFSRVAQEYASGLHVADAVSTGDAAQFLAWKRQELLAPYVPEDVARYIPPEHRDPDGFYASVRSSLCVIAYNTAMVKREDAEKLRQSSRSEVERKDRQSTSELQRHHHDFDLSDGARAELVLSRTIGTAAGSADPVGYRYSEKGRARRTSGYGRRQQVEHAAAQEAGGPIEVVYAADGTPSIVQPSAIFVAAPHPNAARLFQNYLFGVEGQELFVNLGGLRSLHALVKDKPGRTPLSAFKVWKDDPAAVETQGEEIKRRYSQIFGV